MRLFLVDGYNLMHRFPFGSDEKCPLEDRRTRLESELRRFVAASPTGTRIVLVFDGASGVSGRRTSRGGVETCFSRPPQNADTLLLDYCHRLGQSPQTCVVTSDLRDIAGRLEGLPLVRLSSEHFLDLLLERTRRHSGETEKPRGTSRQEARRWAEEFGFDRRRGKSE